MSKSAKGSVHDKTVSDRSRLLIPKGVPKAGDSESGHDDGGAAQEAEDGGVDSGADGVESGVIAASDCGGDREDEDLADRGGQVSESVEASRGDDEECREVAESNVWLTQTGEWENTPTGLVIAQRV